ncbi:hypothetical protein GCM10022232_00310 [Streptomyces plumbiresistens]|uniref:DUF3592 domain-containing protein n=1 Tax=Streptomyces plumbiresistens TaxID=511811 RepID=A0ABP7PYG1_9ACTN
MQYGRAVPLAGDKGEYTVVVRTRERIPRIGEEIEIVYDPQDLSNAENAELASMPSFGRHDIIVLLGWVGIYLVSVSCLAAAD